MINLALIGVGKWGYKYLEAAKKIKSLKIKYLCSPHILRKNLPSSYVKVDDFRKLFNYTDVDGIIIAVPTSAHFKMAKELLEKGYNILLEKPFVTNYSEAIQLRKMFKSRQSTFMISDLYSYHPVLKILKETINMIGRIHVLDFENRKFNESFMGPALWEWGVHDVGIVLELFKNTPLQLSANGFKKNGSKTDNFVNMQLVFKNNIVANIKMGWLYSKRKHTLSILGSNGLFVFDEYKDKKLTFYNSENSSVFYPKYKNESPLENQLKDFASYIAKNKKFTNINKAIDVISILDIAERSINANGKIIKILRG